MAQEDTSERGDLSPLDLDALDDIRRREFLYKGEVRYFVHEDDLSLRDNENLRRLFVRIHDMEQSEPDEDGLLKDINAKILESLDRRVCEITIFECPPGLVAEMSPRQRNALRNAFYRGFDITPYTGRMIQRVIMQARMRNIVSESEPAEVQDDEQPEPLQKPKRPRRKTSHGSPEATAAD